MFEKMLFLCIFNDTAVLMLKNFKEELSITLLFPILRTCAILAYMIIILN